MPPERSAQRFEIIEGFTEPDTRAGDDNGELK